MLEQWVDKIAGGLEPVPWDTQRKVESSEEVRVELESRLSLCFDVLWQLAAGRQ